MRLVFLGTPAFAVPTLERMLEAGHEVLAVYTQPDRPKGRGRELAASPVKQAALRAGTRRSASRSASGGPRSIAELAALRPEAMVVVGYGQIIPQSIIDIPPLGHRQRARLAAAEATAARRRSSGPSPAANPSPASPPCGSTPVWTPGDILLAAGDSDWPEETAVRTGRAPGADGRGSACRDARRPARPERIRPRKQDDALATHAPILRKEDGLIDWNLTAREVYNRVRGFVPWPGAYTRFRGQRLHVWRARLAEAAPPARRVRSAVAGRRLLAGCGEGTWLELLEVQLEGRKRVAAEAFVNGQRVEHR